MSRVREAIRQAKEQIADNVLTLTAAIPQASYREIAALVGCSEDFVQAVVKQAGIKRRSGRKPGKQVSRGER